MAQNTQEHEILSGLYPADICCSKLAIETPEQSVKFVQKWQ